MSHALSVPRFLGYLLDRHRGIKNTGNHASPVLSAARYHGLPETRGPVSSSGKVSWDPVTSPCRGLWSNGPKLLWTPRFWHPAIKVLHAGKLPRELGTFSSSATLVPGLDRWLVNPVTRAAISPTAASGMVSQFHQLPRCLRHLDSRETLVSSCIHAPGHLDPRFLRWPREPGSPGSRGTSGNWEPGCSMSLDRLDSWTIQGSTSPGSLVSSRSMRHGLPGRALPGHLGFNRA